MCTHPVFHILIPLNSHPKTRKNRRKKWMPGFVLTCQRKATVMMLSLVYPRHALPLLLFHQEFLDEVLHPENAMCCSVFLR